MAQLADAFATSVFVRCIGFSLWLLGRYLSAFEPNFGCSLLAQSRHSYLYRCNTSAREAALKLIVVFSCFIFPFTLHFNQQAYFKRGVPTLSGTIGDHFSEV